MMESMHARWHWLHSLPSNFRTVIQKKILDNAKLNESRDSPLDRLTIEIVLCPPLSGATSVLFTVIIFFFPFFFLFFSLNSSQRSGTPRSKQWRPSCRSSAQRFVDDNHSYSLRDRRREGRASGSSRELLTDYKKGEWEGRHGWKLKRDHGESRYTVTRDTVREWCTDVGS